MPTAMCFHQKLEVGDVVRVKSKQDIVSLRDPRGSLPWPSDSGCNDDGNSLFFGYGMFKYCGLSLIVKSVLPEDHHSKYSSYRLCLPPDFDVNESIEDEDGLIWQKSDLEADLRDWVWVPSMLDWPDDLSDEEVEPVSVDSLFEILLASERSIS